VAKGTDDKQDDRSSEHDRTSGVMADLVKKVFDPELRQMEVRRWSDDHANGATAYHDSLLRFKT